VVLEDAVILEAAEVHLIDVLLTDQIEILVEEIEELLEDLEENVEKVKSNSYKILNLTVILLVRFFLWEKCIPVPANIRA
jgi:cellobiose-specific phosphotransferase system component IIB